MVNSATFFAPQLFLKDVLAAISFYKNAFNAIELRRFENDDGTVHVAEMTIDGALFHMHEETSRQDERSPESLRATSVLLGVFVEDPYQFVEQARNAGGLVTHEVTEYDYGYIQGHLTDPFGHHWLIEKKVG